MPPKVSTLLSLTLSSRFCEGPHPSPYRDPDMTQRSRFARLNQLPIFRSIPCRTSQRQTMIVLSLLLTYLSSSRFAYGMLDLGPAKLSVNVFVTMDHTEGSRSPSSVPFVSTSVAKTTAPYLSRTTLPWHAFPEASSYIASAWDDFDGALQESESATAAAAGTFIAVPNTAPTSKLSIPLSSDVSPYLASAWVGMQEALDKLEHSTSGGSLLPIGFSTAFDWSAGNDVESSSRGSYGPHQPPSTSSTNTRHCSKVASHTSHLSAPTTSLASGDHTMSPNPESNGTGTWTWPSIVSTSPTASGLSNESIVANNNANKKSRAEYGAWWTIGAFMLVVGT